MSEKDGGPAQGQMIEPVAYRQDYAMGVADAARVCDGFAAKSYLSEAKSCAAAIRALSVPPSVPEEWVEQRAWEGIGRAHASFDERIRSTQSVLATLAALGIEVRTPEIFPGTKDALDKLKVTK